MIGITNVMTKITMRITKVSKADLKILVIDKPTAETLYPLPQPAAVNISSWSIGFQKSTILRPRSDHCHN